MEIRINVRCSSNHKYVGTPKSIICDNKKFLVSEILENWRGPKGEYFKVKLRNGTIWTIYYNEKIGWGLVI